jgi:hypothetical protein
MRQHVIEVERTSDASPEAVFAVLRNRSGWPAFSNLETCEVTQRVGTVGGVGEVVEFRQGRWMVREEIVVHEPNRQLSYVLLRGAPIRGYRTDITLHPEGARTRIRWRSSFRPLIPFTGAAFARVIRRGEEALVRGLAATVENRKVR